MYARQPRKGHIDIFNIYTQRQVHIITTESSARTNDNLFGDALINACIEKLNLGDFGASFENIRGSS
jgi:hypothetical protein